MNSPNECVTGCDGLEPFYKTLYISLMREVYKNLRNPSQPVTENHFSVEITARGKAMSRSLLNAYVKEHAESLRRTVHEAQVEHERVKEGAAERETDAWRRRLTPLEARLTAILSEIPDEVKTEGLSLHNLQQFLKGRWRGCAHPGELGAALRRLGWSRKRLWRGDAVGFRALWLPPSTLTTKERQS